MASGVWTSLDWISYRALRKLKIMTHEEDIEPTARLILEDDDDIFPWLPAEQFFANVEAVDSFWKHRATRLGVM
jgi:hypothetical protein